MNFFGKEMPVSIGELQDGINRLFDQVWHSGIKTGPFDGQDWAPPLDVIEKNDRYIIEIELVGLSNEDLEVSCTGSQLTIKGHKVRSPVKETNDSCLLAERRFGGFRRIITFNEPVKSDALSAKLEKGLLTIQAPKKTIAAAQSIKIPIVE